MIFGGLLKLETYTDRPLERRLSTCLILEKVKLFICCNILCWVKFLVKHFICRYSKQEIINSFLLY